MARRVDLAVAAAFAVLLIVGALFAADLRIAVAEAFPARSRLIIGGGIAAAIGITTLVAVTQIRDRRRLRYAAIAAALIAGAASARGLSTGDVDTDVVEAFHFVEYGILTLLFYRAWRGARGVSAVLLPLLTGLLVGTLDEWLQWFIPSRVGELRDVALDGVAVACGLVFGVAVSPPVRFTATLDTRSAWRVGLTAAVVIVAVAVFFQSVHLGHDVTEPGIGAFRSRYTHGELKSAARERSVRWRTAWPVEAARLSREDQYLTEAVWHIRRRNQAVALNDAHTAWCENRVLEAFYAPVLERPEYRWPDTQRADLERMAASGARRFCVSDALPYAVYPWPKTLFWTWIALAAAMALAVSVTPYLIAREAVD